MSVFQLVVSLHVHCPHIKYMLIINVMDSGREIKNSYEQSLYS